MQRGFIQIPILIAIIISAVVFGGGSYFVAREMSKPSQNTSNATTTTTAEVQATTTADVEAKKVSEEEPNKQKSENASIPVKSSTFHFETTVAPKSATPPPNSTLCNGVYYSSCATGNDLVCPGDGGKAYCQSISQQAPQQTQSQIKNSTALDEVVATMNRIAATMDKYSATMKEYQQKVLAETAKFNSECGSYTGACYQSYMEIVNYYGDGYQALQKEWNKLDNEYKQYDLMRLQILGQQ